jgi:branched-subunit amino acid ABC-type transport system permease component
MRASSSRCSAWVVAIALSPTRRRLKPLDVILVFGDAGAQGARAAAPATSAERALAQLLAEIDRTTIVVFSAVVVTTTPKTVERTRVGSASRSECVDRRTGPLARKALRVV